MKEQSLTGQGRAFAGEPAATNDASAVFFNPAAITQLKSKEAIVGIHAIAPSSKFKDAGTNYSHTGSVLDSVEAARSALGADNAGFATGTPTPTRPLPTFDTSIDRATVDPYDSATVIPNIFYVDPTGDFSWGIGVTAPFGLGNEFNEDWFGRYDSTKSELSVVEILPTIAWQANEKLSLGVGLGIQNAEATLESASYAYDSGSGVGFDVIGSVKGDSMDFGLNLGLFYKLSSSTNVASATAPPWNMSLKGKSNSEARPLTRAIRQPSQRARSRVTPTLQLVTSQLV